MKWMKVAFVLFSLVLSADGSNEKDIGVTPQELSDLLENHDVTLIDVRKPWELKKEGKIDGSINIPVKDVEAALSLAPEDFKTHYGKELPAKDDRNLIFHCRSGRRSLRAVKLARKMGWICARHLIGGFKAWKKFYY